MRRSPLVLASAAVVVACVVSTACGTLLEGSPDDGTLLDEAGNPLDGSKADGSAGDGATTTSAFSFSVAAPDLLVAGEQTALLVTLDRPAGDATPFKVELEPAMDLTLTGAELPITQRSATLMIVASPSATPRRESLKFHASASLPSGSMPLGATVDVRVAHYYRAPGSTSFAAPAGQTYELTAWGAGGGLGNGGVGGFATVTVTSSTSQPYLVVVGAPGGSPGGGGAGGDVAGGGTAGNGGGFSGVFLGSLLLANAQIIAGGGGGGTTVTSGPAGVGGTGGSPVGGAAGAGDGGAAGGGGGGSNGFGGAGGGDNAGIGLPLSGGAGAGVFQPGGGGGGGHFGGGGGGAGSGGGGGASFAIKAGVTLLGTNATSMNHPLRVLAGNAATNGAVLVVPK